VADRVKYLESVAGNVAFTSPRAATAFVQRQREENGLIYTLKAGKSGRQRTAILQRVDVAAVRDSTEMRRIHHDLKSASKRAGGTRARALEALGRREQFFDWPVGETPA
jgi:hypothetical protein